MWKYKQCEKRDEKISKIRYQMHMSNEEMHFLVRETFMIVDSAFF